jgi:hypothetical protein
MISPRLISIMVGVMSAVLFVSQESASGYIAAILSFLMLLPLLLAGMGWGRSTGQLGLLIASVLIGLAASPKSAFEFLIYIGLPALIFTQLVLLRRESISQEAPQSSQTFPSSKPDGEWYPAGHIIAWASVMAGTVMAFAVGMMEDLTKERESIHKLLEGAGQTSLQQILGPEFNKDTIELLINIVTRLAIPGFAGFFCVLFYMVNVWVALRILNISGQLVRPWPEFSKLEYPPLLLVAFLCAIGIAIQPGVGGDMAMAYVGAFTFIYILLGLAVVHYWAATTSFQPLILAGVYIGLLLSGVFMTLGFAFTFLLVGLGEPLFQLRQRMSQHLPPSGDDNY